MTATYGKPEMWHRFCQMRGFVSHFKKGWDFCCCLVGLVFFTAHASLLLLEEADKSSFSTKVLRSSNVLMHSAKHLECVHSETITISSSSASCENTSAIFRQKLLSRVLHVHPKK